MGEPDGGSVEGDGGHVEFQPPRVPLHRLGVERAAGRGHRHRDLQLAAAGVGVVHVLLVAHWIEGEHPDRPSRADIVGESGSGVRRRVGSVERAGAAAMTGRLAPSRGRLAGVGDQSLVEQRRLHEDRPGEHGRGGAADRRDGLQVVAADARLVRVGAGGGMVDQFDAILIAGADRREEAAAGGGEVAGLPAADERGEVPGG